MNAKRKLTKKIIVADDKSSPEARAKRLKMIRNLANLSRKQLCELCDVNIHTFIGWETARFGGLPLDGAEKIIQKLAQKGVQCSLDWLIYELGAGPTATPDYAIAKMDTQKKHQRISNKNAKKLLLNELIFFRKQYDDATTLLIEDDGMEPFYMRSDYVAGIKKYGKEIKSIIGKDCIIQRDNGQILLRKLRQGKEEGKYTLVCTNPHTSVSEPIIYDETIASAAPVIRLYRH